MRKKKCTLFYGLFFILIAVLFCNVRTTGQQQTPPPEDLVVGGFAASMHPPYGPVTLHTNYDQILDCGLNAIWQRARRPITGNDSTNLSQLAQFDFVYTANDSGAEGTLSAKVDDYIDWISYFTQAKYTKWEAEGSSVFTGNDPNQSNDIMIKHDFGSIYFEGDTSGWASGLDTISIGKFLMGGPDYWQWPRYSYTNTGWNPDPIRYKAIFRMKIDSTSEEELPVCEIFVTQSKYDDSTKTWILKDTLHLPGSPKIDTLTTADLRTFYKDFVVQYNYVGHFDFPSGNPSYPPLPTQVTDPFEDISSRPTMNEGSQVQFKVKWLGNRELYIDYIEVYDEQVWETWFIEDYPALISNIATYDNNFKNANANFYNKLKYYGTIDEPHVVDCYEPLRKIQFILDSLQINADLLVHWFPGWNGYRDGDPTWSYYNELAQPKKIMFWYAPFANNKNDNFKPYPRDFTLFHFRRNLQWAHIEKPEFFITLQSWGTKDIPSGNYVTYMHPTNEELRAGTMLSLAHGVEGIFYEFYYSYYTNAAHTTLGEGLVGVPTGNPPQFAKDTLWYEVQGLASRLLGTFGKTLKPLDYSSSGNIDGFIRLYPYATTSLMGDATTSTLETEDYLSLSSVNPETDTVNFHAGFFDHPSRSDNKYFLLANLITTDSKSLNIGLTPPVGGYDNYRFRNIESEYGFDTTFKDSITVEKEFPAGEGYLFQVAPVVKYGGKLMYDETIDSETTLTDSMIIYESVTLTIEDTYHIDANVTVYGDIVVAEGGLLDVNPGVKLYFYSGTNLTVYGELEAEGSQSNKVIFDGDDWGSIIFDSSSTSSLSYCEIKNGAGIQCLDGSDMEISNCLIEDCTQGIYIYNSEPEISNTRIINPLQNGINANCYGQLIKIEDSEIKKDSSNQEYQDYQGILLANNTESVIFHNDIAGFMWGMYIGGGSIATFGEQDLASYSPNNRVVDCQVGLGIGWGAELYGGLTEEAWGHNSVYDNSTYDIKVYQSSEAYAEDNYWGGEEPSYYVDYTSSLSYEPYLDEDPWEGESMKLAGGTKSGENILLKGGSASFQFLEGLKLERLGRINEAIDLYKGLVRGNIAVEPALSRLLRVAVKHKNNTLIPYLNSLIINSNEIDKAVLLRLSANIKLQQSDFAGAISEFDKIIALNRSEYEVLTTKFSKLFLVINELQNPELASDLLSNITTYTIVEEELKMQLELAEFLLEQLMQNNSRRGLAKGTSELEVVPTQYALYQNYPNPFNPETTIKYDLPDRSDVELIVYDILGKQVRTLVNKQQEAGSYEVRLDGTSLASGVYLYRIKAGRFIDTKKMILLK